MEPRVLFDAWLATLLQPVDAEVPAGPVPDDDPAYQKTAALVQLLRSPGGPSTPREVEKAWETVEREGLRLLRETAKDFVLATSAAQALHVRRGPRGLALGLGLLAGLLRDFKDALHPLDRQEKRCTAALRRFLTDNARMIEQKSAPADWIALLRELVKGLRVQVEARLPGATDDLARLEAAIDTVTARHDEDDAVLSDLAEAIPTTSSVFPPGRGATDHDDVQPPQPQPQPQSPQLPPQSQSQPSQERKGSNDRQGPRSMIQVLGDLGDLAPLLEPVTAAEPIGRAVDDDSRQAEIFAEIRKLDSPFPEHVSWEKIVDNARGLLKDVGKDLVVASFLANALIHTESSESEGLVRGMALLLGLLERYGEDLLPSRKKRRLAALNDFVRTSDALVRRWSTSTVDSDTLHRLIFTAEAFEGGLTRHFGDEAATLGSIVRHARGLLAARDTTDSVGRESTDRDSIDQDSTTRESLSSQSVSPPDRSGALEVDRASKAELRAKDDRAFNATSPAANGRTTATATATPTTTGEPPSPSPPPSSTPASPPRAEEAKTSIPGATPPTLDPTSLTSDVPTFLRKIGDALIESGNRLRRADPATPDAYRLVRVGLWLHLSDPPAHEGHQTRIPPLAKEVCIRLERLEEHGKWSELIEEAEGLLPRQRFALDLHRHTARALEGLGHEDARTTLETEVLSFLARSNGLETLSAADGTPLASDKTRAWLRRAAEAAAASARGRTNAGFSSLRTRPDAVERTPFGLALPADSGTGSTGARTRADLEGETKFLKAIREAESRVAEGDLAGALTLLRSAAITADRGALRFRLELAAARLAAGAGRHDLALAFFEGLEEESLGLDLDLWDPELTVEFLESYLASLTDDSQGSGGVSERVQLVYRRLARLDPMTAMRVRPTK